MKKTLCFLIVAAALVACEPVPSENNNPPIDTVAVLRPTTVDTTLGIDSVDHVVMGDTLGYEGDSLAIVDGDDGNNGDDGEKTGRYANPDIDLDAKSFTVTGHITIVSPYCGGAAPSNEVLENAKKPQAYAKQPILIRKGKTNALGTAMATRTTTDANGDFKVQLPAGDYCLVLAEKENARSNSFKATTTMVIDEKCDSKWLNKCDISFTVKDNNVSGLRLNLKKKCMLTTLSPCISYDGPLPSSAAPRGR